jgi:CRP/FNR family transcriptional regulator
LDEGPNPATAEALDQVTLYLFPRQSFIQMVKKHPDLAWVILENLAQRLRHLTALVEDLSFRTVRGRLAKLLLEQASKGQVEKGGWLTQEEMAARLGTVREVVSRSLRSLEEEGLIRIARHRIIILEREALEEQAV